MKLNKQQRRRIAAQQADKLAEGDASQSATVVCHLGYQLILEQYGALLTADWRKHSGDIACNDRVLIHRTDDSHAVVEAILPRHNALAKWQGRKAKTIAANLDQLLITIAAEPDWQENLIDRHLIAAHYAGIPVAILHNKTDLLDDAATAALEARLAPYQALGIPVYRASLQEDGVPAALRDWLRDKQTILCGQSGVGKSSLIRSLKPDADIWIQAISEATGHGRHTTTNLRRYPLDDATALIDTGSKMDEVIFEEFKGTGNMELQLDRSLSNKRIFPAVNLVASSTRRDDLLQDKTTLDRMWILRKFISDMNPIEAMNSIRNRMVHTKDNDEFLLSMNS